MLTNSSKKQRVNINSIHGPLVNSPLVNGHLNACHTNPLLDSSALILKNISMLLGMVVLIFSVGCGEKQSAQTESPNHQSTSSETVVTETVDADTLNTESPSTETIDTESIDTESLDTESIDTEAAPFIPVKSETIEVGAALYKSTCNKCHDTGLLESPKFGDKEVWAPRVAKGKEVLYKHSSEGFKKMPAQVEGDITQAQVQAAVDYIVEHSS